MSLREDRQEVHTLFAHRGLIGRVSGLNAREERGELGRVEGPGDGFEFGRGYGVGVPVGELCEAREDPVLEVVGHFVGFAGRISELRVWRWSLLDFRRHCRRWRWRLLPFGRFLVWECKSLRKSSLCFFAFYST